MLFHVGSCVTRKGKGAFPSPKYDGCSRGDGGDEGFWRSGKITHISKAGKWNGRMLPKLYFVQFDGQSCGTGVIEEHLSPESMTAGESTEEAAEPRALRRWDRVTVTTLGMEPKEGVVTQLWDESVGARTSGRYGLSKFHVEFSDGNSGWFYDTDITRC